MNETNLSWDEVEEIKADIENNSVVTVYVDEEFYAEFPSSFRQAHERRYGAWRTEYWLNLRDEFPDGWTARIEDEIRLVLLRRALPDIYG